jgi:hypothetical protein
MADEITRGAILREFRRLCDVIDEAEAAGLLDMDEAIAMRDRYRDRADLVLDFFKRAEKVRS